MESNWGAMKDLVQTWKELEGNSDRIVQQYRFLNVAHDVARQMRVFQTKILNQPLPLPNWLPHGGVTESSAESILKRILRQSHEMLKFVTINGKDKKVLDTLVERHPESLPDQDPLLFVCRSQLLMTTGDFLKKYASPFNLCLASDKSWPSNWPGKRLSCPVTFLEKDEDAAPVWGVDLAVSGHSKMLSTTF